MVKNISGIVSQISNEYPYTVTVGKKTFKSNFKFSLGNKIDITVTDGFFNSQDQKGFVHCVPNGMSVYDLTDEEIARAKNPSAKFYLVSSYPEQCLRAIETEQMIAWSRVESFYTYYYQAFFDPKAKTLTTNTAIRRS
jgi:hypothetical protein